jgi:hypothetical protein
MSRRARASAGLAASDPAAGLHARESRAELPPFGTFFLYFCRWSLLRTTGVEEASVCIQPTGGVHCSCRRLGPLLPLPSRAPAVTAHGGQGLSLGAGSCWCSDRSLLAGLQGDRHLKELLADWLEARRGGKTGK